VVLNTLVHVSFLPVNLPDGRVLNIEIKRSKRAKRLWLKANLSGIYLVAPTINCEINHVITFLDSKKQWILKASLYYDRIRNECGEEKYQSNTISFLGKRYSFQIIKDTRSSMTISNNLCKITFHVTDMRHYKDNVRQWYIHETHRIVSERLEFITRMNPIIPRYNKVLIKNHRSRWASCSQKRNLNFNLLLAALPIEIIDYVIIHELAHLIQLNHSNKFWDIVKMIDPEFEAHRKLLHKYSILTRGIPIR
jgi:predicted metal-dependent hydrolase